MALLEDDQGALGVSWLLCTLSEGTVLMSFLYWSLCVQWSVLQ